MLNPKADINDAFQKLTRQTAKASGSGSKETAALSMKQADICPYCKGSMRRVVARGHDAYLCDKDNHVVPVEDSPTT